MLQELNILQELNVFTSCESQNNLTARTERDIWSLTDKTNKKSTCKIKTKAEVETDESWYIKTGNSIKKNWISFILLM